MLLTYPDDQIALFERTGLRSIDFFIRRASGGLGDMPAASLTGFFLAGRLPPEWAHELSGARAWVESAKACAPELFSQAQIRLIDPLGSPVGGVGGAASRLAITFPAIEDAEVSPEQAERMTAEETKLRPELATTPGSVWSSPERRMRWAIYQRTGEIALERLWGLARQSLAALNRASPSPACLPEPAECPFGWFNPASILPAIEAFELSQALGPAKSLPPRSV